MRYSVIIPTNRTAKDIAPTLISLGKQSKLPDRLFILYDKKTTKKVFDDYQNDIQKHTPRSLHNRVIIISEHTADFEPGQGVSYVRNYGILSVQTDYLLSVDDDNTFCDDFVQSLFSYTRRLDKSSIVIPTEYHHGQIRSRGYRGFSYLLGIQLPCKKHGNIVPIQFASSNCLFGLTDIFQQNKFDLQMKFVYEDFDMTRRVTRQGYGLYVVDTAISHNMHPKTALQETYIDTVFRAQQKAKNRIIFVHKNSTARQWFVYICCGLHIHTVFLCCKVLRYPAKSKRKIIRAILSTTYTTLFFNTDADGGKK